MSRFRLKSVASIVGIGALVLGLGAAANADVVYNNLDNTIDATAEVMNLTALGLHGSTTLEIQVLGHPGDHSGCNIQGGPHFIGLTIANDNTVATDVTFVSGTGTEGAIDRFDSCTDKLYVDVNPLAAGTSNVSFSIDSSKTNNDPALTFSLTQASFQVVVADGTTPPPPAVCDADPAAPAWANAILKANDMKNKTTVQNTISSVAHQMTQGAVFGGFAKNAHPDYENAVYTYMTKSKALGGLGLVLPKNAQQSARPGWECSPA